MNINFEAALRLINMEAYDEAEKNLRAAIDEERANGSEETANEYTCVLGELLANQDKKDQARAEFNKVIEYCDKTNPLLVQRMIAQAYLDVFDGKSEALPKPMSSMEKYVQDSKAGKPIQDRAFIARQTRTRGKK